MSEAVASKPVLVSGEAVRAFGSRLTGVMAVAGALGMGVSIWPLWSTPCLRSQAYFLGLFALMSGLATMGLVTLAWYRVRGTPPTFALHVAMMLVAATGAIFPTLVARRRIDLRERGEATELVWPAVRLLRARPDATDDELRAATAHDDLRPMRVFRREAGGACVVVMGAGSLDASGTFLVARLATSTLMLDWTRASTEGDALARVRALLNDGGDGR